MQLQNEFQSEISNWYFIHKKKHAIDNHSTRHNKYMKSARSFVMNSHTHAQRKILTMPIAQWTLIFDVIDGMSLLKIHVLQTFHIARAIISQFNVTLEHNLLLNVFIDTTFLTFLQQCWSIIFRLATRHSSREQALMIF